MELCLFTCPGPSGAIPAPHHQSVSAHGSQPSGPAVPPMSPETSRSPLVFVAHLSFCVFSHPSPHSRMFPLSLLLCSLPSKGGRRGRAMGSVYTALWDCFLFPQEHLWWLLGLASPGAHIPGPGSCTGAFQSCALYCSCLVHGCCLSESSLGSPTSHPSKCHALIKL